VVPGIVKQRFIPSHRFVKFRVHCEVVKRGVEVLVRGEGRRKIFHTFSMVRDASARVVNFEVASGRCLREMLELNRGLRCVSLWSNLPTLSEPALIFNNTIRYLEVVRRFALNAIYSVGNAIHARSHIGFFIV
jgi:hypothetical protein